MKKTSTFLISSLCALALAGCSNMNKQDVGVIAGTVAGGLLGSQFGGGSGKVLATFGGALAGGAIGGMIGHNMDKTDKLQQQMALNNTRTGQSTTWKNPDTGNTYTVKPTKTYEHKGTPCREFVTTAKIGDKTQQIYGTACRQADGSWKVASK